MLAVYICSDSLQPSACIRSHDYCLADINLILVFSVYLFLDARAKRRPLKQINTTCPFEIPRKQSSLRGFHFGVYEYHFNCDFHATRRNSIYGFIHKICQDLTASFNCQALSVACHVTRRSIWAEVPVGFRSCCGDGCHGGAQRECR